ncbi:unnamed protein product [Ceutorhynchus assimilis]|uniref:Uncharacterized protein n=1 Tax=Ceutorhynchus assimilis TaxID=467358 RepID=A0A9N9QRD1_9CUCU|nr:unnamed protein product [Ceutorhynchus assimilis]
MPRVDMLPQHYETASSDSPPRSPPCSPASSSPAAGVSSRSVSPASSDVPIIPRHSAFSLVYPKDISRAKGYLSSMGALMYANSLNSLVPTPYPSYIWHPIPGLFLPYSPAQRPESLSPDQASPVDAGFTPEKAKIDEDAPLNLSLKGRSRTHSIWSPGSLCEQEMKNVVTSKPDSNLDTTIISPVKLLDGRWKWDHEKDFQGKMTGHTIGPSGEKQFTGPELTDATYVRNPEFSAGSNVVISDYF